MKSSEFLTEASDSANLLDTMEGNVYVNLDGANYFVIGVAAQTGTQTLEVQVNPMPVLAVEPAPEAPVETDNVVEGEE
jgi:hypothetical protein